MLQLAVGIAILILVVLDAFITVFSSQGGGWLTNSWTSGLWNGLLKIHAKRPIHRILSFTGPVMLLGIVLVWYVLLVSGWTLVFASSDVSVINSDKQYVTNWYEKLFFVGVTLSTLGYGNMVPREPPWTVLGNLTALSGTVLLTSGLSYILAVMAAGIERRQLASLIHNIGVSVQELIERCWAGQDRGKLDTYLLTIASQVDQHAHKHVVFPILRYFHSTNWSESPSRAVLLFSDAVFLISHGTSDHDRPPASVLHVCERSIANYLDQARRGDSSNGMSSFESDENPPSRPRHLERDVLRDAGLDVLGSADFEKCWSDYEPRRRMLVALCNEDGWKDISHDAYQRK